MPVSETLEERNARSNALKAARRLRDLTRTFGLAGVDDQLAQLPTRVESGDLSAVHLGTRIVLEGLVSHACQIKAIQAERDGRLDNALAGLKKAHLLPEEFFVGAKQIQFASNSFAHFQEASVYATPKSAKSPWMTASHSLEKLVNLIGIFVDHFPNPHPLRQTPETEASRQLRPQGNERSLRLIDNASVHGTDLVNTWLRRRDSPIQLTCPDAPGVTITLTYNPSVAGEAWQFAALRSGLAKPMTITTFLREINQLPQGNISGANPVTIEVRPAGATEE